jgi:predicted DsbA family dithiol-disulfide isomerase
MAVVRLRATWRRRRARWRSMNRVTRLTVEIWSDVVCPWCYLGKRRFEAALAGFEHRDAVEVIWRSFELDPDAPRSQDQSAAETLAAKYGMTVEQAEATHAQMTELAASEGLEYHFDRARRGNTFDAHRLLHLAAARGLQGEAKERLMRGYFTDGEPIGDRDALVRLVAEAGVDAEEARTALAGDAYADAVRADEELARRIGIRGVPFFVLGRRYGISGAQPADALLQALEQAWTETAVAVSG